jgi:two-component system heavy metal sensor histidine kinase CusS
MFWKNNETTADAFSGRSALSNMSIGARLAISYTLSAFGMLAVVTAVLYSILIRGMEWDETQLVVNKVKMFEATLRANGDNMAILDNEVNLEGGAYYPGQYYFVYSRILDEAGKVLIEAPGMEHLLPETVFPPPVVLSQDRDPKAVRYQEAPNGRSYFVMSAWARSGGEDGPRRLIQVAMDETGERGAIATYRRDTLLVLLLATLIFAVVGTFIARRCLRPVYDLARHTERITAANVMSAVDPDSSRWPKELTTLADSFYSMLARIDASFQMCSQCNEDMAHELRNPINCLMGEAEVALAKDRTSDEYRDVLESSLEEYTRLSRMIKELLFIAGADNPYNAIKRTQLIVRGELEAVCEFHDAQAQEQGITITCTGQASLNADPLMFRRAVSNLVSNSLSHTQEGGEISLAVRNTGGDGIVEVAVRDTGSGIKAEDLPRIFDRYYRTEREGSQQNEGTGLGLAIVKSIMKLHDGSVDIESTKGMGTTVTLRFKSTAD